MTRTAVHSWKSQQKQRRTGDASAWRAVGCVQLAAQLLLWGTLYAYDRSAQAAWQACVMLLVPLLAVYGLWKKGQRGLTARSGPYAALALLPCLMLDACVCLLALSGLIVEMTPQLPAWLGIVAPAAACGLTALCALPRGVRYGTLCLRGALLLLFVCGTFFLRASTRADRLWPLLGRGLASTARTALAGSGAVWCAALLFALPQQDDASRPIGWALTPWVLACLWLLWFGFVRPWAPGDDLPVARKLLGLSRNASGVWVYELAGLMWLLLLLTSLTGCLTAGEVLLCRAWSGFPRWLALLCVLLPGVLALLLHSEGIHALLRRALPFRAVWCALSGAVLWFLGRRV